MSGTRALVVDPLDPVACEVLPPWTALVPARPEARSSLSSQRDREHAGRE